MVQNRENINWTEYQALGQGKQIFSCDIQGIGLEFGVDMKASIHPGLYQISDEGLTVWEIFCKFSQMMKLLHY